MPSMIEPKELLEDLVIGESPRWHDDRLWFAHWGTGQIVAVDLDGAREVVAEGPPGLGWSIDWLSDGRLLVTGEELMRREPDGSMVRHADLSAIADHGWNEIVVDRRGNIYVNGMGFRFGAEEFRPGIIALVTPDGSAREVANGIAFPNGMVVTPDGSSLIISESFAGKLTAFGIAEDGVCRTGATGRAASVPTGSASTPRARSGPDPEGPGACGLARAARSWTGSSWTSCRSHACSAVPTGGRCSSWLRTGTWARTPPTTWPGSPPGRVRAGY
jgi:sugar lactone lactonase YvrE